MNPVDRNTRSTGAGEHKLALYPIKIYSLVTEKKKKNVHIFTYFRRSYRDTRHSKLSSTVLRHEIQ